MLPTPTACLGLPAPAGECGAAAATLSLDTHMHTQLLLLLISVVMTTPCTTPARACLAPRSKCFSVGCLKKDFRDGEGLGVGG